VEAIFFHALGSLPRHFRGGLAEENSFEVRADFFGDHYDKPEKRPGCKVRFAEGFENWMAGGVWAYRQKPFLGCLFSREVLDKKNVSCNFGGRQRKESNRRPPGYKLLVTEIPYI